MVVASKVGEPDCRLRGVCVRPHNAIAHPNGPPVPHSPGLLPYNPLYRSTVLWDGLAAYAALELASLPDPFNPPVPAIGFTLNLQALHIRVNASGFTLPTNGSHHQQVAVPLTMVADTFNATQELSVDLICGTIAGSLLIP